MKAVFKRVVIVESSTYWPAVSPANALPVVLRPTRVAIARSRDSGAEARGEFSARLVPVIYDQKNVEI
jgi:hypothetical protein